MGRQMMESFGDRLRRILLERRMSQSDLARLVWNETRTDNRGYDVVVGKDRISAYVNNHAAPEPRTLQMIAAALKMSVEELAPELVSAHNANATPPAIKIEALAGHTDKVLLQVRRLVPLSYAVRIAEILSELEHDNSVRNLSGRPVSGADPRPRQTR